MGLLSKALGSLTGAIFGDSGSFLSNTFDNAMSAAGNISGSDFLSAAASLYGGISANNANAKQAALNRQFQADMSNTSYQRAMADMRAAGLNPMLAYSQGGATTPSGATAVMNDAVTPALSSGRHAKRVNAEVENMVRTNRLIGAQTVTQQSQTELNYANYKKAQADTAQSISSARNLMADTKLKEADTNLKKAGLVGALNDAAAERNLGSTNSTARKMFDTLRLIKK